MDHIETAILNCYGIREAEQNMVFAARLTQHGHTIQNMTDLMDLYHQSYSRKTVENIASLPHPTVQKFMVITVAIVGASRRFLAQITRHQNEVKYMSASLQYSNYSGHAAFAIPYEIMKADKEIQDLYKRSCQSDLDHYEALCAAGIDHDAAGYATPQGLRNVLIISATPYQWKYMIGQRTCRRNTDETRIVLLSIWQKLYKLSPILFAPDLTGPFCQRSTCMEKQMSCQKPISKIWTPSDILKADYPLLVRKEVNSHEDYKGRGNKTKKEIEYKKEIGSFVVRKCKTLDELLTEYVALYGKENWALSTYEGNVSVINNYILPIIGDTKLSEINTRFIEKYYQSLLKTKAVINPLAGKSKNEYVSTGTIRDIHKLLRNCFEQAVKWELVEKNPCTHATVPKHKSQKREIWTAETLMYAMSVCDDDRLKLAMNISFSCCLRIGELLGLTWDCVDISLEAIEENRAYVYINKESQRVKKAALEALDGKDVLLVFPTQHKNNKTVRILKTPKTESSIRKVFLPKSVANMLIDWKAQQDEMKEILGDEYMDYNLVMASTFGLPLGDGAIRNPLNRLIEEYNLPPVVFHSLRHTSVTYKLKLNGGDIKAVQGDSGHAQVNMVTDVYSHILDDDRRKNAEIFEEAFYEKKNLDPQMHTQQEKNNSAVTEEIDPELLAKVLANPEMRALLNSLAKTMK